MTEFPLSLLVLVSQFDVGRIQVDDPIQSWITETFELLRGLAQALSDELQIPKLGIVHHSLGQFIKRFIRVQNPCNRLDVLHTGR